jgi:hypothetical protein
MYGPQSRVSVEKVFDEGWMNNDEFANFVFYWLFPHKHT